MRIHVCLFLLLGLTITLLEPVQGLAQQGGSKKGKKGGDFSGGQGGGRSVGPSGSFGGSGFFGGGSFGSGGSSAYSQDPNQRWNGSAGSRDAGSRSDTSDPRQQRFLEMMSQRFGGNTGAMSGQQMQMLQQGMGMMSSRMGGGSFAGGMGSSFGNSLDGRGNGRGSFEGRGGPSEGRGGPSQGRGGMNPEAMADAMFNRLDQNGDGLINPDEMPEQLRVEREKFDLNGDGFIDANEFRAFTRARAQQAMQERGQGQGQSGGESWDYVPGLFEDEDRKPVVYRAGKLPRDIPAWFRELDTDEDGQIGLYEWRASRRSVEEFQEMDRNGDGFLVVEEVMRVTPSSRGQGRDSSDSSRFAQNGFGMSGEGGMPSWPGSGSWNGGGMFNGNGGGANRMFGNNGGDSGGDPGFGGRSFGGNNGSPFGGPGSRPQGKEKGKGGKGKGN